MQRRIVPLDLLEQVAVDLVDAILDLADHQLGELLVALHQRRLLRDDDFYGVTVAVVGERDRRADDGRKHEGQNQRNARALPNHRHRPPTSFAGSDVEGSRSRARLVLFLLAFCCSSVSSKARSPSSGIVRVLACVAVLLEAHRQRSAARPRQHQRRHAQQRAVDVVDDLRAARASEARRSSIFFDLWPRPARPAA